MNAVVEISDRELRFYRRYHQNQLFNEIVGYFASLAESGELKKSDIAKRLRKHPSQITNWLTEPGNMSIDTISDLLVAMGAAMEVKVRRAHLSQQSANAAAESFSEWQEAREAAKGFQELSQTGRAPGKATGGHNTLLRDSKASAA
jgi:hypothetical protein